MNLPQNVLHSFPCNDNQEWKQVTSVFQNNRCMDVKDEYQVPVFLLPKIKNKF